jgi:hypothetical protein
MKNDVTQMFPFLAYSCVLVLGKFSIIYQHQKVEESDLHVAYPHESMSCLCPRNEAAYPPKSGVLLLARDPS